MPVHVSPGIQGQPVKAYVACDRRDDMGRIPIASPLLQQWQITEYQVARWIARTLELKGKSKKDKEPGTIHIGNAQGKKKSGSLEWVGQTPISLKASGHFLPLIEVIYFKGNHLQIDQAAIIKMVDRLPPSETPGRYQPSEVKREARKLDTQTRHKDWQKAYRKLKREHPNKSDNWCALQIDRMPIGKGFQSETIRKNMKK